MSQLPNINNSLLNPQQSGQGAGAASALNDVDLDDFLNLMIAELQNQDPLNPLENDELIAQISQIREVGATEQLTQTLSAVLLGQNISSATNLIGAKITALSDDNQRVEGVVNRISIAGGNPKLHLDLNPTVQPSEQPGDLDAGTYRYRIVWEDPGGTLVGVETTEPISVSGQSGEDASILISNLPVSNGPKRVYRTDASGEGSYRFVNTLTNGSAGTYLDTTSDANLSQNVLTGTPQFLNNTSRGFTVSLNNIDEIRPRGG